MSYTSKRTIVSMLAGVLVIAAYVIYALGASSPAPDNLKSWSVVMLIFIGIGVAANVVIQILFHILFAIGVAVRERESSDSEIEREIAASVVEDERDRLIGLKSARVGYAVTGSGVVIALAALALGNTAVLALHIIIGACAVGSIFEGCAGVYFHERGVRNG